MKHLSIAAAIAVFILLLGTGAHAQRHGMGVQACLGLPVGDYSDSYNMGFGVQGIYLSNMTGDLYAGGTVGYKYFPFESSDGSLRTFPLMAALRYNFGKSGELTPYIGGELGVHIWGWSREGTFGDVDGTGSNFGYAPMIGLYVPAGSLQVDINLRYDAIVWEGPDFTWVGLNAGVLFNL
jgi:hypothetical protein